MRTPGGGTPASPNAFDSLGLAIFAVAPRRPRRPPLASARCPQPRPFLLEVPAREPEFLCPRPRVHIVFLNFAALSSTVSLRAVLKVGQGMSVAGAPWLQTKMSVLSYGAFGSSLSVRSLAHTAGQLSVLNYPHVASAVSLRTHALMGATLSCMGDQEEKYYMGGMFSVLERTNIASGISLRNCSFFIKSAMKSIKKPLASTITLSGTNIDLSAPAALPGPSPCGLSPDSNVVSPLIPI